MRLTGKIAVVTGAGVGVGKGIEEELGKEGADLAVADINREWGERTAAELRKSGRRAIFVQADVSNRPDIERMVATCVRELGGLDILVNNVGISRATPFIDLTDETWDLVMNTNLKSAFMGSQAVARYWIANKRQGRIINISSTDEQLPYPFIVAYCSSKAGMNMLTKTTALALAEHGINVNSIAPGLVESEMTRKQMGDPAYMAVLPARVALARMGRPSEIGRAAVFFASSDSDYVTGTTLLVDGGHVITPAWQVITKFREHLRAAGQPK